jgi:hypothetical protein
LPVDTPDCAFGGRGWRSGDQSIAGGASNFPATEFLFGVRDGYRSGPFGVFATIRPGFFRFDDRNLTRAITFS